MGPDFESFELGEIRLVGGRIDSLSKTVVAHGETVVDADGAFVLPGLVDAHVHLDLEGGDDILAGWRASREVRDRVIWRNGLRALASGTTSVRDLGSADYAALEYGRRVAAAAIVGPRVAACGRMIMQTGGHAWQAGRQADGPWDVRRAVREQVRERAQLIKVMASAGFSTPGDVHRGEFTLEELCAAVQEAHRSGLPVAAHAHAADGIAACLEAGIDTIEHGAFLEPGQITEMAGRGTPLVPTLRAIDVIGPDTPVAAEVLEKVEAGRARYETSIRAAIEGRVAIAAGTDAGTSFNTHGRLVDELERYVELGMQPVEALRAAIIVAGRLVGADVGELSPGAAADLLVVEKDPRHDLGALRSLRHVIRDGQILDLEWLNGIVDSFSEGDGAESSGESAKEGDRSEVSR